MSCRLICMRGYFLKFSTQSTCLVVALLYFSTRQLSCYTPLSAVYVTVSPQTEQVPQLHCPEVLRSCPHADVAAHRQPMKALRSPSEVIMEDIAWSGHLPVMRGGVATFTLQASKPFALTLQADPKRYAGATPWRLLTCVAWICITFLSCRHVHLPKHLSASIRYNVWCVQHFRPVAAGWESRSQLQEHAWCHPPVTTPPLMLAQQVRSLWHLEQGVSCHLALQ